MDTKEVFLKFLPIAKKNWLPLSLGILGLTFFAYGLMGLFSTNKNEADSVTFEASKEKESQKSTLITVDIEGAVVKPGVYKLSQDSRIQDGLVAAGGLSGEADREYVSKTLNLATRLADGTKIYIPRISEAANEVLTLNSSSQDTAANSLININTASESELDILPGIGPVTAGKIISGRPYNAIGELLDKKIVSGKVFDQIKERIAVY